MKGTEDTMQAQTQGSGLQLPPAAASDILAALDRVDEWFDGEGCSLDEFGYFDGEDDWEPDTIDLERSAR